MYTDVKVNHSGFVRWAPPAIYQSYCAVTVTWFPYDEQSCQLKFIVWTHEVQYVELKFHPKVITTTRHTADGGVVISSERGMDLSHYAKSAEWDLLETTATRNAQIYPGCCGPRGYYDITYAFSFRRMTLFYTVNLIVPTMLISLLSLLTFYLPSDSYEKITLSISIHVCLSYLFLLLWDIIPPTSLSLPMLLKYILFDLIIVSASIAVTILQLSFHYKEGLHSKMPSWVRRVFLVHLASLLRVEEPSDENEVDAPQSEFRGGDVHRNVRGLGVEGEGEHVPLIPIVANPSPRMQASDCKVSSNICGQKKAEKSQLALTLTEREGPATQKTKSDASLKRARLNRRILERVAANVGYIAQHFREEEQEDDLDAEWKYLALVTDRLALWIFTTASIVGTIAIVFTAPSIYDTREPLKTPTPMTGY